jgi:hypothetical protein
MVQQRKVATRTRGAFQKRKKILDCIGMHPEGVTPKIISRETGININTIKSILPQLGSDIKRVTRGWYKVYSEGDGTLSSGGDLSDWNFHNLVLSAPCGGGVDGWERVFDFLLVKCSFVVANGRAVCRVSSDWPLNVSAICFVAGFFSEFCDVDIRDVLVSSIEFNKDYRNLRLDGVKSISVTGLIEQFKVYQKKRGLRIEHKTKVPMAVENIVDMLSQNPMSLELHTKLHQQTDALASLARAVSINTDMLYKLFEVKNEKKEV